MSKANFYKTEFSDTANFNTAIFKDETHFGYAKFESIVHFSNAELKEDTDFTFAVFKGLERQSLQTSFRFIKQNFDWDYYLQLLCFQNLAPQNFNSVFVTKNCCVFLGKLFFLIVTILKFRFIKINMISKFCFIKRKLVCKLCLSKRS